jgi:hypothetical protein
MNWFKLSGIALATMAPAQGGAAINTATGGNGGPGMAVFRFYSQKP